MKILNIPRIARFFPNPADEGGLLGGSAGALLQLDVEGWHVVEYGAEPRAFGAIRFREMAYTLSVDPGCDLDLHSLRKGCCRFRDGFGNSLQLAPELSYLLYYATADRHCGRLMDGNLLAGTVEGFPEEFEAAFLLADVTTGLFLANERLDMENSTVCLAESGILGFDKRARRLLCLDLDLN